MDPDRQSWVSRIAAVSVPVKEVPSSVHTTGRQPCRMPHSRPVPRMAAMVFPLPGSPICCPEMESASSGARIKAITSTAAKSITRPIPARTAAEGMA